MLVNPIFSGSTLCSSFAYESPMKKMNNKDDVLKKLRNEDFRIDSTNNEEIRFSCKEYKFLLSMKSNQIKVLTTANSEFEKCLINFLEDTLRKLFRNEKIYMNRKEMKKMENKKYQIKEPVYTIGNKEMWEKEGPVHACRLCGRYFDKDEKYYRINNPVLGGHFLVHYDEWNDFVSDCKKEEDVAVKLLYKKKPRTSNATKPNVELADKMKKILERRGFYIVSDTRNKITFRLHKRKRVLGTFVYDKRYIRITNKSDNMNGMLSRHLFVQSLMNELLGTDEDFVRDVNNKVKEIFG